MLRSLPSLDKLIRHLQQVPYLASKNLYRVASYFLTQDEKKLKSLCQALIDAKRFIKRCARCTSWCEGEEVCVLCRDPKRDQHLLCVVETWHDLLALERAGSYNGVYHVLGGVLSPLDGVGPDDLTIVHLLERIPQENITEVIFATNQTPEGEATANFIVSKLKGDSVTISRLASGVPTGGNLEMMDKVTIYKALLGRRPF